LKVLVDTPDLKQAGNGVSHRGADRATLKRELRVLTVHEERKMTTAGVRVYTMGG